MIRAITRDDLRAKLRDMPGRTLLIDVRSKEDYERAHIKGAISIPLPELSMTADKSFARDQDIIVYCGSFECQLSSNAAQTLHEMGYENVLEYEGGLKDWQTAGFMVESKESLKAA
ncbi:MAG TPA: rhodanese-like domain-containing protein [Nitrospirota bacterium]|jgi:rhodanese-related sulfurtransferase